MRRKLKVDPTVAFLHSYGIRVSPGMLDEMVKEAVIRLHQTLYPDDPRTDLTTGEAEALRRGGFSLEPEDLGREDPLARTAAEFVALLKASLSTAAVARKLGVDPSRIRQRLTSQPPSLYGIRLSSGWVIPDFQFDGDRLIPGVGDVVAGLDPELHPVAVQRWFTTPNPDLMVEDESRSLSPRDWLRFGLPAQAVIDLAADL